MTALSPEDRMLFDLKPKDAPKELFGREQELKMLTIPTAS